MMMQPMPPAGPKKTGGAPTKQQKQPAPKVEEEEALDEEVSG